MEPNQFSEEIDLQKYWLVLKRRWLPATGVFGVVMALTSLHILTNKPSYLAQAKLLFKSSDTPTLVGVGVEIGQLEALASKSNPLDTEAEIVRSEPVLQKAVERLNLTDEQGNYVDPNTIAAGLSVKGIIGTDILQIFYRTGDPELAAAVVNAVMDAYIENNIQSNRAEAMSAGAFIAGQLPRTEAAVRQADLALRQFKEQNKIIVLQEEASQAVRIIGSLEDQIAQSQAQLADVTARTKRLLTQVGMDSQMAVVYSSLSQTPGVQDVLTQLQEAQQELAVEQTRYRSGHPTITTLERRVAALNALLLERTGQVIGANQQIPTGNLQIGDLRRDLIASLVDSEVERSGLINKIAALTNEQTAYRRRASVLPKLEQTQRELERQLNAAQTTYETLLRRLQEIQVAENQNVGNASIISPASVPKKPVDDGKKLSLAAGASVGLLWAIATAFALDLLDRSVKTVKEAKDLFRYTLLGIVPAFSSKNGKLFLPIEGVDRPFPAVIVRDLPRSPIAEAYQMLQANLKFLSSDKPLKTVVVTSSVAKEGKSEVSANLAASMAQVGRRVLLIDADMRRSAQHHIWGLTNAMGLSNVIVDQVAIEQAVQEVMPNLYVLPSGVIPPNPVALLDSKRMALLIDACAQDYDFVIFDTPALAGTADAAVLGKMTDGIILVVRPMVVDSASAKAAKEFLNQSGQNVLGLVINGVNVKSEADSYFYYSEDHTSQYSLSESPESLTLIKQISNAMGKGNRS